MKIGFLVITDNNWACFTEGKELPCFLGEDGRTYFVDGKVELPVDDLVTLKVVYKFTPEENPAEQVLQKIINSGEFSNWVNQGLQGWINRIKAYGPDLEDYEKDDGPLTTDQLNAVSMCSSASGKPTNRFNKNLL